MNGKKSGMRYPLRKNGGLWDPAIHGPLYIVYDFFVPVESQEFILFAFAPQRAYVSREVFERLWLKPAEKR